MAHRRERASFVPLEDQPRKAMTTEPTQNELRILIKSMLVAKAALENDRKFVQQHGSEDDANLNHDALYHVEHCLTALSPSPPKSLRHRGPAKPEDSSENPNHSFYRKLICPKCKWRTLRKEEKPFGKCNKCGADMAHQ